MSEIQLARILSTIKDNELEKMFRKCCEGDISVPIVAICEETLKDYYTLLHYHNNNLLLNFVQRTVECTRNYITYANLEDPAHLYMYMQTIYSGFFVFVSLIIDLNNNLLNTVENVNHVFKTFSISLEKLISIDYYPLIQNNIFLKVVVFYLTKYNMKNNDLIITMTKYAFSNSRVSHLSKINWINTLREYIILIPEKSEAKFLLQKLCLCLRKLNQDHYGSLLIKSSGNQ